MTAQTYERAMPGAIIGYGFIASQGHVPGYAECCRRGIRIEIVALADICEERRERARKEHPLAFVYDDFRRMLDKHARDLDFVDVAVPPAIHAEVVSTALDRGLHVLRETPLATNLAGAVALAKRAIGCRSVPFPCHNYRHAPAALVVRHIVDQGVIGTVHSAMHQTFLPTHARGVHEWRPDWRRDPTIAGGGVLMDQGIHAVYLASAWLGGFPQAVSARTYTLDGFDTEDNVGGTFCYTNGLLHVTLSWTSGPRKQLHTLHGSKGAIFADEDTIRVFLRDQAARLPPFLAQTSGVVMTASNWNDASHREWFSDMFADFVTAIDEGVFVGKASVASGDGRRSPRHLFEY